MAYLTVTTSFDVVDPGDGKLSLREAVAQANSSASADTIRFIAALEGTTLVLTGGELTVTQTLTIDGDQNGDGAEITVDGNANERLLNISGSGTNMTLKNLTLTNGNSSLVGNDGGAIYVNSGNLKVIESTIIGNHGDYGRGGGIFAVSIYGIGTSVDVISSSIVGNYSSSYWEGGGIAVSGNVSLTIRDSQIVGNTSGYYGKGGGISVIDGSLLLERSTIASNDVGGNGGGIYLANSSAAITNSVISGNSGGIGGGVFSVNGNLAISDSTIANNKATYEYDSDGGFGGGICTFSNTLSIDNSTITGNSVTLNNGLGGGIFISSSSTARIGNSLVSGNTAAAGTAFGPDISGTVTLSNGRNVFGTDILGNVSGDRENVAPGAIFAAIDPATGGGQLSPGGIVPLKKAVANPALSGADPLSASAFGQLGTTKRPLPVGSLPDIGSIEISQPLSTSPTVNNDVITGTNAVNKLVGLAGNDLIKGLGGNDTIDGGDGSDFLDGGPGNDTLKGGLGLDLVTYAGNVAVVIDLSGTKDTAKRGSEIDTLIGIEGGLGSSKNDTFKGDAANNEFQGKAGKDIFTGGAGRDTYDFNAVADSPVGANRDVIKDFVHLSDIIDVAGIDADTTLPGDQSFRWVGRATLTGAAQLGYYVGGGGNTIVRASTDADAAAEVEIQLTGAKVLTAGDFRF